MGRGTAAAAVLLAQTACQATPQPASPPALAAAELRVGLTAPPASLDPHELNDFLTFNVLSNVCEGLVALDPSLRIRPALAASWTSPDDRRWLFELRRGVAFHDGRPLAAADVVFSLERARTLPKGQYASYLADVESVRALGDQTVEVTTSRPNRVLLHKLAFVLIVPRDSPPRIETPIGTGPYGLALERGGTVVLTAFDRYWGPRPSVKNVRFVSVRGAHRSAALLAGQVDLLMDLAPAEASEVSRAEGLKVVAEPGPLVDVLWVRVSGTPFRDRRVRQAVHLALDRPALVQEILRGYGRPATQLVSHNVYGFDPAIAAPARDLATARRLLAEAGHPRGLDVTLEHRAEQLVEPVIRQLAEAGIRVRSEPRHWHALLRRLSRREAVFAYVSLISDSGEASDIFQSTLHTRDAARGLGDANDTGYSSPAFDAAVEEATRAEPFDRQALLQRCMRLAMEDLPRVPLVERDRLSGVRGDVVWVSRADGRILAQDLRRVRVAP